MGSDPRHQVKAGPVTPPVQATLGDADALLEQVFSELSQMLTSALTDDAEVRLPPPAASLAINVSDELAERSRHHGKRLRPTLAHWGWVVGGGDDRTRRDLVQVAAALELLHLFALIQDDVMDRSDSRRGRPSVHVVASELHRRAAGLGSAELFGDSVAVLVSDLALSEASMLVASAAPRVRAAWRIMTVELVEGQLLDLTHTAGRGRDPETARLISRAKSGRYTIRRPLQLGALVADADPALVGELGVWGDLVGDAFAMRDDILGIWGDPGLTGKPAGDDLRSGKPTALLSWAVELLPRRQRRLLHACDTGSLTDQHVVELQQAMIDAGVLERAERSIAETLSSARQTLTALDIEDVPRAALRDVAEAAAWRTT